MGFETAETPMEILQQLAGAASTCWVGGTGDAVFDFNQAKEFCEDAMTRLIEIGWASPEQTTLSHDHTMPYDFSLPKDGDPNCPECNGSGYVFIREGNVTRPGGACRCNPNQHSHAHTITGGS